MRKITFCIILVFAATSLFAQEKPENKSNLKFTFNERLRIETFDNISDLSNLGTGNQTYMRAKSVFGLEWSLSNDIILTTKVTNEFRKYLTPKKNPFHWNELFIENLNLKLNIEPGTFTIGRQDIVLGEGFVFKDGTPLDGTRSYYFNAIRFDWKIDKSNTLSFFTIYQPKEDNILPVLNGKDLESSSQGEDSFILNEQEEKAIGTYYTGDFGKTNLQGYFLWRGINANSSRLLSKSNIYMLGSRVKSPLADQFSLTAEAAYQFGTAGDYNRSAYGGYAYLDFKTNFESLFLPRLITLGTILLSGDDISTPDNEAWDPAYGRWPKWNTSMTSLYSKEVGRSSYWTNLLNLYIKIELPITKELDLILWENILSAPQKTAKTSFLSGDNKDKGSLTCIQFVFKASANVTGHFIVEHMEPGDFYFKGHDNYTYVRTELMIAL